MNLLELHISYLLSRHDCVIVPGWGAFVASYVPAAIDYANGTITAPHRMVGFNSALIHNDGLLASSVARSLSVSYDTAVEQIASEVESLRQALAADGQALFAPIGRFVASGDGVVEFIPMKSQLTAPAFYQLAPVAITPIREIARREAGEDAVETFAPTPRIPRFIKATVRYAASIAALVGLGLLLSTPVIVDESALTASVNPLQDITVTAPKATSPAELLPRSNASTLYLALPSDGCEMADTIARQNHKLAISHRAENTAATTYSPMSHRLNDSDPYCLIVASLATQSEAERFISRTGNPSLRILEKDGRYRVYAATGATSSEAQSALRDPSIKRNYPGAWVCHR